MSLISTSILSDQSLCHPTWLQLETTDTTTEILVLEQLETLLTEISNRAQQQKVTQISLLYPVEWKTLEEQLLKKKWHKGLVELQKELVLPLKNRSLNQSIKTHPLPFASLREILKEQATYHATAYPDYYASAQTIDWHRYAADIDADSTLPTTIQASWVENNKVLGTLIGASDTTTAHIYEFVVAKAARGKGVGTLLLESFLQQVPARGAKKTLVETWWNQPSLSLYLRHGFTVKKQECYLHL